MKKYVFIVLFSAVAGLFFAHKVNAEGNGSIRIAYPVTDNIYWVKGNTYDVTFYSKNWNQVIWLLNCDGNIPMLSTFDIVGDTSVETLQRIRVAISNDSAESSKCYIRIQGGSGNVRWVNYDMNGIPFHIVAPIAPLGKLMIADVVGVKSSYAAPATISATIKATKPDGTPAVSSEFLNVQAYVSYANPIPSGASGPGVGDNAVYNPSTGLWQWTAPKALPAGDYVLKVVLYCSMTGSKCIWQYGNMNQVEKSIPFTVKSGSASNSWKITVWNKTTGANMSNASRNQTVKTGDILWFVVEGPANQWFRYCFKLNDSNYSCDSNTTPEYKTDEQGRNDHLQVVASIGQSTGAFDASVYGTGFTSNHVLYTVSQTYNTPTPTPVYTPTPTPTTIPPYYACSTWPRNEVIDPNKIYSTEEICDGDLIRAQGDIAVYIVKIKNNKRFIRRFFGPQIFKAYGHLNFSKVKNVTKETLSLFSNSPYIKLHNVSDIKLLDDIVPGKSAKLYRAIASGIDDDSVFIINDFEYKLYRLQ